MPWVNTTAADRAGNVLYADHSVVPNVPDDLAAAVHDPDRPGAVRRLAGLPGLDGTRADVDCAWGTDADAQRPGHLRSGEPARRRSAATGWSTPTTPTGCPTPTQRLEGFARIIGCEQCERTLRTRMVYRYVMDRLPARRPAEVESPRDAARATSTQNRVLAAEVMRENGDLDDGLRGRRRRPRRATVLAAWDGRSDARRPSAPTSSRSSCEAAARPTGRLAGAVRRRPTRSTPRATSTRPTRRWSRRCATRSPPCASAGIAVRRAVGHRSRSPATGAPRRSRSAAARRRGGNANAAGLAQPGGTTRTATARSPTAPRTSRRSRSSTAAGSTPARS